MNYLSQRLSNLTSLVMLLILSIMTAGMFLMASSVSSQANELFEYADATFGSGAVGLFDEL